MDWQESAEYGAARRSRASITIYADRPALRVDLREDALASDLVVARAGALGALFGDEGLGFGDIALIDCPVADAETVAGLAQADLRAARAGARFVVSTSTAALDAVFGCVVETDAIFLVDPTRAERAIALGSMLARLPAGSVRELSEADRLMLLRLTEQVGQIAGRIDSLSPGPQAGKGASAFDFAQPAEAERPPGTRVSRPPLPDPRLVRKLIRQRQLRARYFDGELFADPAWDMLLDLTAARAEHVRVSVSSLCIASGVPPTTALRWIGQMVEAGLFERLCDESDRRRAFIALSDPTAESMARYFSALGPPAAISV